MSGKNKRQYGVWMDTRHATIVGRANIEDGNFVVLAHVENAGADTHLSEKTTHHQEISLTQKFFKEIAAKMPNIDEIHLTGTGQIQEEFIKFLADTPQYKNAVSGESTSNKMSDENLVAFIAKYFN